MSRSGSWSSRIIRVVLPILLATPVALAIPPGVSPALAFSTSSTFAYGFSSNGIGPVGVAFDATSNLWATDYPDGTLYRFGPAGGSASANFVAGGLGGRAAGLAFTQDGRLYLARQGIGDVVELSTSTGAVLRQVVTGLPNPTGLATDPISGDLFLSLAGGGPHVYRILNFRNGPGTLTNFASVDVDGIAFAPDGTLYAAGGGSVFKIAGTNTANPGTVTALNQSGFPYDGIAVASNITGHAAFLYVNRNDGVITKIDLTASPATTSDIITGGSRGDFAAVGRDGCLYATQSSTIIKVTDSAGACNPPLAPSTPASGPPPTAQAGGGSPSGPPQSSCQQTGYPVNCATGEFWHRFIDLSVKARGLGLSVARTYSTTLAAQDGPLGFGWTHSYSMHLQVNGDGSVTIQEEGGSVLTFEPSGSSYQAPSWVYASLTKNADGSYTLRRKNQTSFTFSPSGQLSSEQDRNGHPTSLVYTNGQLSTVTDSAGRQLSFAYSGSHLATITDPIQRTVSFQYDASGNLASVTDVGGGVTRMTYDANHLMLTMTDPNGGVLGNQYDSAGRVASQSDPMGRTTTWSYAGGMTTITNPKGNVTQETYTSGRLSALTKGFGTAQAATWSMTYDQASLGLTSVTDPNGHTTRYTLDAFANVLSTSDPLGRVWSFTYDGLNDPTSVTDPLGQTTRLSYDAIGNLTTISRPLTSSATATSTIAYDPAQPGDVIAVTDPDGNTRKLSHDQFGNVSQTTDPLGNVSSFGFDGIGRMTASVSPRGNGPGGTPGAFTTSLGYDAFGNVLTTTDALGHKTTYQYDGDHNLVATTDANGHTTSFAYDLDNEPLSGKRADGSVVRYSYDAGANVISQTDALGHATTFSYDALNRLNATTDPLGRSTQYGYDAAGNSTTETDATGRTTTFSYDPAKELTAIAYSDAKTPNVSFTYDQDGRRVGTSDGTGASSYAYDAAGRIVQSINGAGAKVGYGYDPNGNRTSLAYPDGSAVTRTFDASGHLATLTDWAGRQTRFSFDADGNLTTQAYPNGAQARFTYDAADQLTQITDSVPAGQIAFTESRDNVGQLTAESVVGEPPGGPINYAYDPAGRLTSANYGGPALAYQYDAADRLTQITNSLGQQPIVSTLTYDNADELLNLASTQGTTVTQNLQFSYDANGNRTQVTNQSGLSTSYTYDQANRLTTFGTNSRYVYNGDGLRVAKSVNGLSEAFTWDLSGQLPIIIQDGTTRYVTGPGGLPLEQVTASGTVRYYHQDALGSTRALTDATGQVDSVYAYDPYGNVVSFSGSSTPNPFQFAGQYRDAESGLQYLRARYYDPPTAQFISSDPISVATRHRYAYALDNPIGNVDPTGLFNLVQDLGPYAGTISAFLAGLVLITLPDPVVSGALDVASTAFGVLGAVYDCGKSWFSWNCAISVAGAVVGGISIAARIGRLLWTLPVLLARSNLQSLAYAAIDLAGGAEKINAFAYQAIQLQHLADSFGFQALSAALTAIGEFLDYLTVLAQPATASSAAGGSTPAVVPAC